MSAPFNFKDVIKNEDAGSHETSRWSLPHVGEHAKKIQTVEEIEANLKRIENEAFQKGYQDGLSKGKEEGVEQALTETMGMVNERLGRMDQLLECFHEPISQLSFEVEHELLGLIKVLFTNFLDKEITLNDEYVLKIIDDALKELPICNEKKYLYLSEQDKAFLDEVSSEYKKEWAEKYGQLVIDVNPDFTRGEVYIKTTETTIDGTVETRIRNLINTEED
jgi:flagellar assembly protein FliH